MIGGMDEIKIECFRVYYFKVKQLKGKKKKKTLDWWSGVDQNRIL